MMKRWGIFGMSVMLLAGCTDSLTSPPVSVIPSDEQITTWTREDFKDIYDQYDEVAPLLSALEHYGITPFRETFERVIIAAHGLEHTYADIYPFKLDDGTYATIYEGTDGTIANGTESVAPLFWREDSFQQFVEEIEKRKYGTSAPPKEVVLTRDDFQTVFSRHVYTSALLIELDESGVQLHREPVKNMTVSVEMRVKHTADFLIFKLQDGYAVIFDHDGEILKRPDSTEAFFWDESEYEQLIEQLG